MDKSTNIPLRKRKRTEQIVDMIRLHEDWKMSLQQVANKYETTVESVSMAIYRYKKINS